MYTLANPSAVSAPTTTRLASSRFRRVIGRPSPDEWWRGSACGGNREVPPATLEGGRWGKRSFPPRERAGGERRSSCSDLLLVAPHHGPRGVVAAQGVVEQLLPLGLAQLRREQRAHVDGAVELDAADYVPRQALVDDHMAVALGSDEVRAPEAPDGDAAHGHDQHQHEQREQRPPACVAVLVAMLDDDRRDPVV